MVGLVQDNYINQKILVKMLNSLGYVLSAAHDVAVNGKLGVDMIMRCNDKRNQHQPTKPYDVCFMVPPPLSYIHIVISYRYVQCFICLCLCS